MPKKLTITVSDDVYDGLYRHIGPRRIGRFLEELARPHVTSMDLERAYREAALDEVAEAEAKEWIEADLGAVLPDDEFTAPAR